MIHFNMMVPLWTIHLGIPHDYGNPHLWAEIIVGFEAIIVGVALNPLVDKLIICCFKIAIWGVPHGCTPKSSISTGFSLINHPFWGNPMYGNLHVEWCTLFSDAALIVGPWINVNLVGLSSILCLSSKLGDGSERRNRCDKNTRWQVRYRHWRQR